MASVYLPKHGAKLSEKKSEKESEEERGNGWYHNEEKAERNGEKCEKCDAQGGSGENDAQPLGEEGESLAGVAFGEGGVELDALLSVSKRLLVLHTPSQISDPDPDRPEQTQRAQQRQQRQQQAAQAAP